MTVLAFRCKTCGRLEEAHHAGEQTSPSSCRVCGNGGHRSGPPSLPGKPEHRPYVTDPSNWEILADATPERLAELGLSKDKVVAHVPVKGGIVDRLPQILERKAVENLAVQDKAN